MKVLIQKSQLSKNYDKCPVTWSLAILCINGINNICRFVISIYFRISISIWLRQVRSIFFNFVDFCRMLSILIKMINVDILFLTASIAARSYKSISCCCCCSWTFLNFSCISPFLPNIHIVGILVILLILGILGNPWTSLDILGILGHPWNP